MGPVTATIATAFERATATAFAGATVIAFKGVVDRVTATVATTFAGAVGPVAAAVAAKKRDGGRAFLI